MGFPLEFVRGKFPSLAGTPTLGFDAAFNPEPLSSVAALDKGGALYDANDDRLLADTRESLAYFLNSNEQWAQDEIVFAPGTRVLHERLSRVMSRWFPAESEIVMSELQDESTIEAWLSLSEEDGGHNVKFWEVQKPECQLNLKRLEQQLTDRTQLVVMSKSSATVGTVNELLPVALHMRDREGFLLVDWSPFVSHGSLDIRFLRSDFLVASTQSMYGSELAWLWGKREHMTRIREEMPEAFEGLEVSRNQLSKLKAVLDYFEQLGHASEDLQLPPSEDFGRRRHMRRSMQAVRHYERELSTLMLRRMEAIPGVRVYGIDESIRAAQRTPRVLFSVNGVEPGEVKHQMRQAGVRVHAGEFDCPRLMRRLELSQSGAVSASMAHYHREEDVEQFAEVLREVR